MFKKIFKPLPPLTVSPYKTNPDQYLVDKGIVVYPITKIGKKLTTNLVKNENTLPPKSK